MEPTAISLAIRALRSRLAASLAMDERHIYIGNPAVAARLVEGQATHQSLNLFVFQVEHSGYPADSTSADPTFVRIQCLITALGADQQISGVTVGAGENDLRLIGGMMATLHQHPVLSIVEQDSDRELASLQVVPSPLTVETINNLWSTQVDTSYRLSAAYELALAPVPLAVPVERSSRVARAEADARVVLDTHVGPWVPEIRLVVDGTLIRTRSLSYSDLPAEIQVAVAGTPGQTVMLSWEVWDPAQGWHPSLAAAHPVDVDSESLAGSTAHAVPVPTLEPDLARQLMLVAHRTIERAGRSVRLRSEPLLLAVFSEAEEE